MGDPTLTREAPTSTRAQRRTWKHVLARLSLSRVQAIVGTLAGIVSIAGALFSISPFARSANIGELVATVQEAVSHRAVADATIEVLTRQNDVVATLRPDSSGRASQDLKEGVYVVRVSHPRYAVEERRVQVLSHQTVEIRANLRAGSSTPVQRAVDNGMRAVRRALRF